ncbi:hypothetical protein [Muriicola sp. Z0-33]|uniref:hypothetical protein n=1 Tax=Muriicola sp. Z0-33 TaxID=2816957 RepID=UPI0022377917|nr:hypothetical protein [Muriicola sp. Z0-33]MCW5516154.1 hypothetical protein [Muriicola sp. Z0-33]
MKNSHFYSTFNMPNSLIIMLIMTTFYATGQDDLKYLNFHTESGSRKIIWELIVENEKPKDSLMKSYLDNVIIKNNIANHKLTDNSILGFMKEVYMPDSGLPMNFKYNISFKKGRYRIQIFEILFMTSKTSLDGFSFGDTPVESWFLNGKGSKFKTGKTNVQLMKKIDSFFKNEFVIKNTSDSDDDDW